MTTTVLDVEQQWTTGARYTAAAAVDVLLSNSGGVALRFTLTEDDTIPTIPVHDAPVLGIRGNIPMQLRLGERLWISGADGKATVLE